MGSLNAMGRVHDLSKNLCAVGSICVLEAESVSCGASLFTSRICMLLGESVFCGVSSCVLERLCVPEEGPM